MSVGHETGRVGVAGRWATTQPLKFSKLVKILVNRILRTLEENGARIFLMAYLYIEVRFCDSEVFLAKFILVASLIEESLPGVSIKKVKCCISQRHR